jgi:cytidylate kinase
MEADIVHELAGRLDVQLDAGTLQQLLNGDPAIVEGRNPALLATVASEVCGKEEHLLYKLYLVCSPRERALRYLLREYGEGMRDEVNRKLPEDRESEADWTAAIREGVLPDDDAAMARYTHFMPESVMAEFQENQFRDKDDRARYLAIYGVDYRDGSWYDAIVDTSGETAEVNFTKTLAAMEGSAFVASHAAANRSDSTARPSSAEAIAA